MCPHPSFCHIHTKMPSSFPSTTSTEFKRLHRNLKRREYYYRGTNNAEKLEEVRRDILQLAEGVKQYESYEALRRSEDERSEIINNLSSAEPIAQSETSEEEPSKPSKPKTKKLVEQVVMPPRWSRSDVMKHLLLALVLILMFYFVEPVEPTA